MAFCVPSSQRQFVCHPSTASSLPRGVLLRSFLTVAVLSFPLAPPLAVLLQGVLLRSLLSDSTFFPPVRRRLFSLTAFFCVLSSQRQFVCSLNMLFLYSLTTFFCFLPHSRSSFFPPSAPRLAVLPEGVLLRSLRGCCSRRSVPALSLVLAAGQASHAAPPGPEGGFVALFVLSSGWVFFFFFITL